MQQWRTVKNASRKTSKTSGWPRKIRLGRAGVTIYRRRIPSGWHFMVSNYATGKRRFDSYATEAEALEAAQRLVRQLSEQQVLAAGLTNNQAAEYAAAVQTLKPHGVSLIAAASALDKALSKVKDLPALLAAVDFYHARHKTLTRKPVAEVVAELLAVKESRGKSDRYLADLRFRLGRFADAFRKDCCDVTTAEVQAWLDSLGLSNQSYKNFRTVAHQLFAFAVARGYASDNPVAGTEKVEAENREPDPYKPSEIRKLLAAATPDFLPCLAIGAFAGLRTSELLRLEWSDIRLDERHIVIGAHKAKTASRRIVPICDALAAWLAPYAAHSGKVWTGPDRGFFDAESATGEAAGIEWKHNGLRESFASYRLAQCCDVGRVAHECGNSREVLLKHYVELVRPSDAEKWFAIRPEAPSNVLPMTAAA
jgi:integrase